MPLYLDSHIHTSARTLDEMAAMKAAGVAAVVEPAFWRPELHAQGSSIRDYFNTLVGQERFRASQSDLCHYCTIGLNPREANDPRLAEQVLEILPLYADKEGVVAIGEIGFEEMTAREEKAFRLQLQLAKKKNLPVLVRTPHINKEQAALLSMHLCEEEKLPPQQVIIGHGNEETVEDTLSRGYWAAFSLSSVNGIECESLIRIVQRYAGERILVNSAAEWGWGHPLALPGIAEMMLQRGIAAETIHAVCYSNALAAYSQSGRMSEADWLNAMPLPQQSNESMALASEAFATLEELPASFIR